MEVLMVDNILNNSYFVAGKIYERVMLAQRNGNTNRTDVLSSMHISKDCKPDEIIMLVRASLRHTVELELIVLSASYLIQIRSRR